MGDTNRGTRVRTLVITTAGLDLVVTLVAVTTFFPAAPASDGAAPLAARSFSLPDAATERLVVRRVCGGRVMESGV